MMLCQNSIANNLFPTLQHLPISCRQHFGNTLSIYCLQHAGPVLVPLQLL